MYMYSTRNMRRQYLRNLNNSFVNKKARKCSSVIKLYAPQVEAESLINNASVEFSQLKSSLDYFKRHVRSRKGRKSLRRNWPCLNVRCGRLLEAFSAKFKYKRGTQFARRTLRRVVYLSGKVLRKNPQLVTSHVSNE